MRPVVIALLGLAVFAGCKDSETERAGEVIAVAGDVEVVRGDAEPAALEVGDKVSGSDRVRTGDDGEVKIKLAHNGVILVYGGGADVLVGEAPGWAASGDVGSTALDPDPDDKTSAAGINSESEAATDPNAALADERAADDTATETKTDSKVGSRETGGGELDGDSKAGGGPSAGPSSDDPAPRADPPPAIAVTGGSEKARAVVRRLLLQRAKAIRGCLEPSGDEARLSLAVAGGKLVPLSIEGGDASARSCLTAMLRSIAVPDSVGATKGMGAVIEL